MTKENKMTDENSTNSKPAEQGQTASTEQPDARPPKGPINSNPHNKIITHDEKPLITRTIITEDNEE